MFLKAPFRNERGFFYGILILPALYSMRLLYLLLPVISISSCQEAAPDSFTKPNPPIPESPATLNGIQVPDGFTRVSAAPGSFTHWLRSLPCKKNKTVYLYDGRVKSNQQAQFAVLDLGPVSRLQQCADVVIRLRAEFLFATGQYDSIRFTDFEQGQYKWTGGNNRVQFDRYLQQVFGMCGSASLEKQMHPVIPFQDIQPGDVLVHGGFPGHALIVADMAVNEKGEKVFLLIQGYMPAQDIHVLVNPLDPERGPWFSIPSTDSIYTPEWIFHQQALHRW